MHTHTVHLGATAAANFERPVPWNWNDHSSALVFGNSPQATLTQLVALGGWLLFTTKHRCSVPVLGRGKVSLR